MWLRLKQAQLNCKSTTCILGLEEGRIEKCKVKNNLVCKIVLEAKKLNISFRSEKLEMKCKIEGTGTEIVGLVSGKELQNFLKEGRLNVFFLEQLLDIESERMLTWKQVKQIRGISAKGRAPEWYRSLESSPLEDPLSRKLKAPQKKVNFLHMKANLETISNDRRRQEWLVFGKGSNKTELGKIMKKKTSQEFLVEHWKKDFVDE